MLCEVARSVLRRMSCIGQLKPEQCALHCFRGVSNWVTRRSLVGDSFVGIPSSRGVPIPLHCQTGIMSTPPPRDRDTARSGPSQEAEDAKKLGRFCKNRWCNTISGHGCEG
mmetsp:Transcript_75185/g.156654  ORF Transcript_75185/g.156654 Transcript_75185/m.156654 type:complete len:111 (-) Transcript_75185:20-352(-)